MDENRKEGLKNEVKGGAKEIAGKVTGNAAKEVASNLQKNVGKVQTKLAKPPMRRVRTQRKTRVE
jgi:uncharacterized protein YjbJ (UPF0337 family)